LNKEALVLVKASMIMLNKYADLLASAELLEEAMKIAGKEEVTQIMLDLADVNESSPEELKIIKAELILTHLSPVLDIPGE
jgi:hypothetical protein